MIWYEPRSQREVREDEIRALSLSLGLDPSLAEILICRGYHTPQEAEHFLHPSLEDLDDPMKILDMGKAVERIRQALDRHEAIVVYGDYDADGVCASSILVEYLRSQGGQVGYYIPERHREGYGLNEEAVRSLAAQNYRLMITVDCGIASRTEAALAAALGMDVIITDHHECPTQLPEAVAVLDLKRPGETYRFHELCGAGLAGRLVEALGGRNAMLRCLDLMALATVADLVPLVEENRAIVSEGLKTISQGSRPGLRALIEAAGLAPDRISAGQLAFQLGPRINAGGRMDVSSKSVELMITGDEALAQEIAQQLDQDNARRKAVGEQIAQQAMAWVESQIDLSRDRGIVLWSDHWDSGVQGIVASRMVEQYHRPTILLTREEDHYVGSARSIPGVHLYQILEGCKDLLIRFGGHEMAAGMSVASENLERFCRRFNDLLREKTDGKRYLPRQNYDLSLTLSNMNESFVEQLSTLAPYGMGNPSVVVRVQAQMEDIRPMGADGAHFRASLVDDSGLCQAVAFRMDAPDNAGDGQYDLLVSPGFNEWKGRRSLQCQIHCYQRAEVKLQTQADAIPLQCWGERALSQLMLGDPGGAGIACTAKAEALAWLTEDPFGTLVLAHTPSGVSALTDAYLLHVSAGTCQGAMACQNTLVLAPDYERLAEAGRWRRLLLLDQPISWHAVEILAKRLHCEQIGSIMKDNSFEYPNLWPQFGDDELRRCFVGLRKMMVQGRRFYSRKGALALAADAMGLSQSCARIALGVFSELGLVCFYDDAPYLVLVPGKKVQLSDSVLYGRAAAYFRR